MRIAHIKTQKDILELTKIWYKRVHQLYKIWHNISATTEHTTKAFILWRIMIKRLLVLNQITINHYQPYIPTSFLPGGIDYNKINFEINEYKRV